MEVEAKFSIPDRALFDRLCQLGQWGDYRSEPAGVIRVHDRYLDTDDRAILRAGYAFRVRRKRQDPSPPLPARSAGDPAVLQDEREGGDAKPAEGTACSATLKGLGGADADSGIHQRAEYEVPIEQDDPTTWPESHARDLVLQLSDGRPLYELFSLSQERHLYLLYDDGPECTRRVAELSLDMVMLVIKGQKEDQPGEKPRPYYELEIELLEQGRESDLRVLAGDLRTLWGLRPEPRSKFERGLALTSGVTPGSGHSPGQLTAGDQGEELVEEPLAVEERELVLEEEETIQPPCAIESDWGSVPQPELESPGLLPDDPMSEAGRKTLWFHFLRMVKHEPGTRAGEDIEELHDMRVATRRMRAAMRVFGDFFEPEAIRPFNKGLRRVTRALGPVRDLDVFEEKAGYYLETLPEAARGGLDPLIETWHTQRETRREEMLAFLDSDRHGKFKRRFAEFLQTEGAGARPIRQDRPVPYQVRHVAPRLIYTRYEAVRAYETVLEDAQIKTLHALRIDCKYLRYTLEFLREVLGPEGEAVIDAVKVMQDHLGDLNDAVVAIDLLSAFLSDWDATQSRVPASQRRGVEGIVTYLAHCQAEKHRLLSAFPEAWDRLNRPEVRRWLALAVVAL